MPKKQDMVSAPLVYIRNTLLHVWLIHKSATKVNGFYCSPSPLKRVVTRMSSERTSKLLSNCLDLHAQIYRVIVIIISIITIIMLPINTLLKYRTFILEIFWHSRKATNCRRTCKRWLKKNT